MSSAKLRMFEQFAELARVLGNAHRLELLELVAQGERSVERLTGLTGLSTANVSQHLQHLRRGGLVAARRDGKRIFYSLGDPAVLALLAALRRCAERNRAEVQRIVADCFTRLDELEAVSRKQLQQRIRRGEVTVLDVRPRDEFALGHLPGAVNIPLAELNRRLKELPKKQEIVAYCRGAYCVFSFEAVAALRSKGYRARRLEDGFPEWRAAGLRVESALAGDSAAA